MNTIPGFLFSGIHAGLKKSGKKDLALIYSEIPATTSAVFTKNIVKASPVILGQQRVKDGLCQALMINSGNANACNGPSGYESSVETTRILSDKLKIDESLVIPSSTGVIGKKLPSGKIKKAIPRLIRNLGANNIKDTAIAIKTTDKFEKFGHRKFKINNKTASIGIIGKGAGMICPDMATMLCFIVTDLKVSKSALNRALKIASDNSFNKITVDGDTSTNDSVFLLANGLLGNRELKLTSKSFNKFTRILTEMCLDIAQLIVEDGEGATKVVKIEVRGAKTLRDAEKIVKTVANSQLTKTAFYGEDANWGRIVGAAGRSGVNFKPEKLVLSFDGIKVYANGAQFQPESKYSAVFKKPKFTVTIDLNEGNYEFHTFTSDLTHEYISINSDYRS